MKVFIGFCSVLCMVRVLIKWRKMKVVCSRKKTLGKQLDAVLVNETKACDTSIRLH